MVKVNKEIYLTGLHLDKYDFIMNNFKNIITSYEDLNIIDFDKVIEWEHNKIKSKLQYYFEIYYKNNFVGVVKLRKKEDQETPYLDLDDFYIKQELQGKGIGSAVLKHFINYAKKENLPLRLCVFKKNVCAKAFYEKFGFVMCEELQTRIIMQLELNLQ